MRQLRPYLWQGDITDLNLFKLEAIREKYGITLAVNVGSTNFIPPDMFAIHLPMVDEQSDFRKNDWQEVLAVLNLVVDVIHHGGRILVTCDAGISRSIAFSGMLISVLERCERGDSNLWMDDALMQEIRHPAGESLSELWKAARNALAAWWVP